MRKGLLTKYAACFTNVKILALTCFGIDQWPTWNMSADRLLDILKKISEVSPQNYAPEYYEPYTFCSCWSVVCCWKAVWLKLKTTASTYIHPWDTQFLRHLRQRGFPVWGIAWALFSPWKAPRLAPSSCARSPLCGIASSPGGPVVVPPLCTWW